MIRSIRVNEAGPNRDNRRSSWGKEGLAMGMPCP